MIQGVLGDQDGLRYRCGRERTWAWFSLDRTPALGGRWQTSFLMALCLATILMGMPRLSAAGEENDRFNRWLTGLRQEALSQGISESLLDQVLMGLGPSARVIELYRNQAEFRMSFDRYLELVAPLPRVAEGRMRLEENRTLLQEIAGRYGVQPKIIVALWGIESDFGRRMGDFPVVGSLATLAFEGRRARFYRGELLSALRILHDGDIKSEQMVGSWAGATGQCQFMPSSFRRYAVDYNSNGRRDIWEDRADILASIANYLSRQGWRENEPWGQEVTLPGTFDRRLLGKNHRLALAKWEKMGVTPLGGGSFSRLNGKVSLIQPGGPGGRVFAVYKNWHTLMKWNRSIFFATAVGYLADRIGER